MVTDVLINGLLLIVKGMLSIIPQFSWSIDHTGFGTFLDVVSSVCYLLPFRNLSLIIGLAVSFTIVRAVISLIKTIWDLFPIL